MTAALSLAELEAFDPYAPAGRRERRFCCPLPDTPCVGKPVDASHRSLSANIESGAWHCSRCEGSGKLKEWWTDRPRESRRTRQRAAVRQAFALSEPADISDVITNSAWRHHLRNVVPLDGTPGETYLLNERHIAIDLAHAAGVRYSPRWQDYWPAVVFPCRDREGNLVGAQGRRLDERAPKFLSTEQTAPGVFATNNAWKGPALILVESPICALTLHQAGFPAIALFGKSNCPVWLPQACAFRKVLIAFDGDKAGDEAAPQLAKRLRPLGARVERFRPNWFKDWNELAPRLPEGLARAIAAALAE